MQSTVLVKEKNPQLLLSADARIGRVGGELVSERVRRINNEFLSRGGIFPYAPEHEDGGTPAYLIIVDYKELKVPVNCDERRPLSMLRYKPGGGQVVMLLRPLSAREEGVVYKLHPQEALCSAEDFLKLIGAYNDEYDEFKMLRPPLKQPAKQMHAMA